MADQSVERTVVLTLQQFHQPLHFSWWPSASHIAADQPYQHRIRRNTHCRARDKHRRPLRQDTEAVAGKFHEKFRGQDQARAHREAWRHDRRRSSSVQKKVGGKHLTFDNPL